MLAFVCPHCGIRLQVEERFAGQPVRCRSCRGVAVTSTAALLLAAPTQPPPAPLAVPVPGAEGLDLARLLAPPRAADEIGRLGPYRILEVLGAGGMGIVFRAEDVQLRRQVAVKVMRPELAVNAIHHQRYLREAQAAAMFEHDHVVTIHQIGEDRGIPYLVMPLLQGETLEARLQRQQRLPLAEVLRIARETASALAAAHERGLVHRDVKPGNIWLEAPRGRVKILDFGLARAKYEDVRLTQSGAMVGSPGYMAPEQVRGGPPDPRSDLFSLGCVLYRCCTGRLPFQGRDTLSLLAALATETPLPVRQLVAEVPAALEALLMRLLAREAAVRPPSAAAVLAALAAIEQGATAEVPAPLVVLAPPSPDTLPPDMEGEKRIVSAPARGLHLGCVLGLVAGGLAGVAALVLLIAGLVWLARPGPGPDPAPQPAAEAPNMPFERIAAAVRARTYRLTTEVGGAWGNEPFQDVPPEGGLLIGFEVGFGKFTVEDVIDYLRPIYLTARGEKFGPPLGKPTQRMQTVKAKPGFAVAAIEALGGGVLDALDLTYRPIGKNGLRREGEYRSGFVPDRKGQGKRVDGEGAFVIGITGRTWREGKPTKVAPVLYRPEPE